MNLWDRIDEAQRRISEGLTPMRIPVQSTDPDIVLSECRMVIQQLRQVVQDCREQLSIEGWTERADALGDVLELLGIETRP